MFIIYKNKGILIPLYLIVCFITIAILTKTLSDYFNIQINGNSDFWFIAGCAFLFSGLWAKLTCEDFVEVEGKRHKVDIDNRFFFIKMKIWAYVLSGFGILILISGIINVLF